MHNIATFAQPENRMTIAKTKTFIQLAIALNGKKKQQTNNPPGS